jgi:anti-anti-sigma factor
MHRGDGMKVISLPGSRVALMVGDVAGSGAVASTTMARLLTILRDRLEDGTSALGAVRYVDRYAASAPPAIGATIAVAVISLHDGGFEYAAAGHPPPLHWGPGGVRPLALAPSRPLGTGGHGASAVGQLAANDVLILYTDGLLSFRNETIADAHARMGAALESFADIDPHGGLDRPDDVCGLLLSEVVAGDRVPDDIALLVAERTSRPPPLVASGHATPGYVAELATELEEWLDGIGAGLLDHLALRQAFTELANNVVQHAYSGSTDGEHPLSLHAELSERGVLRLQIGDTGHWRDSTRRPGRGLVIAGGLVDSLQLNRAVDGTTVILRQELGRAVPVLQASQLHSRDSPRSERPPSLRTQVVGSRLVVSGEVDERCATEFRNRVHEATRAGTSDVVVDLSEVTLLASSAIRILFDYIERSHASGAQLTVTATHGSVAEHVLRLVDLPHSSPIRP